VSIAAPQNSPRADAHVLRLLKEHVLYAKEAEEQQRRVDKLIADNADEWDTKSAVCGL